MRGLLSQCNVVRRIRYSEWWKRAIRWHIYPSKHKTLHKSCCNVGKNRKLTQCSGIKWNESGFRQPLCTYRLNWARRTSWGWWDDWDDTVLQTQDSKFEPCRSEAEHATSRSGRLPTILTFTRGWGRNIFCFFQTAGTGNRAPNLAVLTTTLGPPPVLWSADWQCGVYSHNAM